MEVTDKVGHNGFIDIFANYMTYIRRNRFYSL
jgi:hypothetical protein